jgi:hypothetical protein
MTKDVHYNRPGAPTNPPQHFPGEGPADGAALRRDEPRDGLPTGEGTAPPELDVADPHPSNEAHGDDADGPQAARPAKADIGPNPAVHTGSPPPRPHNAGSGPESGRKPVIEQG